MSNEEEQHDPRASSEKNGGQQGSSSALWHPEVRQELHEGVGIERSEANDGGEAGDAGDRVGVATILLI